MQNNSMIKKIALGLFAGIICGLFGTGGGLVLVPAYVYLLKLDEKNARATSILSILPMVLFSGLIYNKGNYINWNLGFFCAVGGVIGGIIGAKLLKKLGTQKLKIIFAIFLIYASIKMLF